MGFWIMFLVLGVAFGGTSAFIATNKNRDGLGWFCLGFFFSFFALVAICAVPALNAKVQENSPDDAGSCSAALDLNKPWLRG
jgi:hypothetical protein